eukprot:scaffold60392_cov22-Tisochrysis_lutea.AAC.1
MWLHVNGAGSRAELAAKVAELEAQAEKSASEAAQASARAAHAESDAATAKAELKATIEALEASACTRYVVHAVILRYVCYFPAVLAGMLWRQSNTEVTCAIVPQSHLPCLVNPLCCGGSQAQKPTYITLGYCVTEPSFLLNQPPTLWRQSSTKVHVHSTELLRHRAIFHA